MQCAKHFLSPLARCALAAFCCCAATAAQAADLDAQNAVDRLLASGWEATFQSRADVDRAYEALPSSVRAGAEVRYGLALVKIKQRRYSEALADIEGLEPNDALGRQATKMRVWLLTMLKDYDAALVEMEKFAAAVVAGQKNDPQAAPSLDTARYLGRIFGYLEGPAADTATARARERFERKLADIYSDPERTAFDEGRGAVVQQFLDYTEEKEDVRRDALDAAEEERLRLLRDAEATREDIKDREEELSKQDAKLREQREQELQKIASQDEPLAGELTRLDGQARVVNRELALLSGDIADLQARARREEDRDRRRLLYREASRLSLLASRYDADLLALETQAATIAAKRAELRRQEQQIEAQFDDQLDAIGKERSVLRRRSRRVDIDEKSALKPNTGNTRRVRSLSAQAQAFTTYEPFPLEEEKRRLLELLEQ